VPPDLVRCFLLNGLRRPSRATLLPPGWVRPESSRCSTSRTACDLPVHQLGRGLSSSSGDTAMRYTPSSCTSSLYTLLPCTAPPAAGLALAPALPHHSRARPNCVRSWPASCLAYTVRILLARCHATAAAPPAFAPRAYTASVRASTLLRRHQPTPALLAPRPLRRCCAPAPSRAAVARAPAPLARAALAPPEPWPPAAAAPARPWPRCARPAVALGLPQRASARPSARAPRPSRAALLPGGGEGERKK
jgi:hypothetical protein